MYRRTPSHPPGQASARPLLSSERRVGFVCRRWRAPALSRMSTTTAAIEEAGQACEVCRCRSLYLDAATGALRCPRCDLAHSKDGTCGNVSIDADGSQVRFVPDCFDQMMLDGVMAEVAWEQRGDRLPNGTVVLQPRHIAYQERRLALRWWAFGPLNAWPLPVRLTTCQLRTATRG